MKGKQKSTQSLNSADKKKRIFVRRDYLATIIRCLNLRKQGKSRSQVVAMMKEELKDKNFEISSSNWDRWRQKEAEYRSATPELASDKSHALSKDPIVHCTRQAKKVFWSTMGRIRQNFK